MTKTLLSCVLIAFLQACAGDSTGIYMPDGGEDADGASANPPDEHFACTFTPPAMTYEFTYEITLGLTTCQVNYGKLRHSGAATLRTADEQERAACEVTWTDPESRETSIDAVPLDGTYTFERDGNVVRVNHRAPDGSVRGYFGSEKIELVASLLPSATGGDGVCSGSADPGPAERCGDGVVGPSEECECAEGTTDLCVGRETCADLGIGTGPLLCDPATCTYKTDVCSQ